MKRFVALMSVACSVALNAQANVFDYNADPGSGYQYYWNSQTRLTLDDVNRVSTLPIKQINIRIFNGSGASANVVAYAYSANSDGTVGTLLASSTFTATTGVYQIQWTALPANFAAGIQNLWIGVRPLSNQVGMLITPPPGNPTVGTSQDVFAWDQDGNGTIDANNYFYFGGNPLANFAIQVLVPEPASMIALGSGLMGLVALRRRSKRKLTYV